MKVKIFGGQMFLERLLTHYNNEKQRYYTRQLS
jgi:hypothetical protein